MNKQLMADIGQALVLSELKTPVRITNNGVTYDRTTTINSRSIDIGDYSGAEYLSITKPDLKIDRKIISFWLVPDYKPSYGSTRSIFSLHSTNVVYGHAMSFQHEFNAIMQLFYTNSLTSPAGVNTYDTSWNIGDLLHFCLFYDYSAELENDKSMAMYVNGVLIDTDTVTWDIYNIGNKYIGRGNLTFHDGGIYDFCIHDYQLDSDLRRNWTQLEIANAFYNNDFGVDGSYLFSNEYTYLNDLAKAGTYRPIFKVELKRRSNTSLTLFDDKFIDITDYVVAGGIGDIEIGQKDIELDESEIVIPSVDIIFNNIKGAFNDNTWEGSLFYGAYALEGSYIRLSLGFEVIEEDLSRIQYLNVAFKGIIDEENIDYNNYPSVTVPCQGYIGLFRKKYIHEVIVGEPNVMSSTSMITQIMLDFISDYGDVFNISFNGVTFQGDYLIDVANRVHDTQLDFLNSVCEEIGAKFIFSEKSITMLTYDFESYEVERKPFVNDSATVALWLFDYRDTSVPNNIYWRDVTANNNDMHTSTTLASRIDDIESLSKKKGIKFIDNSSIAADSLTNIPSESDICYEFLVKFDNISYTADAFVGNYPDGLPFFSHKNYIFDADTPNQLAMFFHDTNNISIRIDGALVADEEGSIILENMVPAGQWVYIAINLSYTDNFYEVFVNGRSKIKEYYEFSINSYVYDYINFVHNATVSRNCFSIDCVRISDVIRTETEILQNFYNFFGSNNSAIINNVGSFSDYGINKNIISNIGYNNGIKNVFNYVVCEQATEEVYKLMFSGSLVGGNGVFSIVWIDRSGEYPVVAGFSKTYSPGFSYLEMANDINVAIGDTVNAMYDGEYLVLSVVGSISYHKIYAQTISSSLYWKNIYWSSYIDNTTNTIGFFTQYYDQRTLIVSDNSSILLHGKKQYKLKNENNRITNNKELYNVANKILSEKKDAKFRTNFQAKYLENVFLPGEFFDTISQFTLDLAQKPAVGGSLTMGEDSFVPAIKGGYIPWAGKETKTNWVTGLVISYNNKFTEWKGREV